MCQNKSLGGAIAIDAVANNLVVADFPQAARLVEVGGAQRFYTRSSSLRQNYADEGAIEMLTGFLRKDE